jgi:hypothetical protein
MMGEKADTIEAAEKQGRIVPGYTQDEVNNFWKSTDDKTLRYKQLVVSSSGLSNEHAEMSNKLQNQKE